MIDQYSVAMFDRGQSPKTVRRRCLSVRRFARWLGGEELLFSATDEQVIRWLSGLEVAPHVRGYYLGDLHAFYRWAVRWRHTTVDPTTDLDQPKRPRRKPRPISNEDLALALVWAKDTPRLYAILVLAAFAGLRVIEIARLDATDIDRDRGVLTVVGKGDKERTVPMHPWVIEVVAGTRRGPIVRAEGEARAVTEAYVGLLVSRHLRSIGSDATAHRLRHWFATETFRACKDIRVVQELLGHSDADTTAGYISITDERAHAAVAALTLDVDLAAPALIGTSGCHDVPTSPGSGLETSGRLDVLTSRPGGNVWWTGKGQSVWMSGAGAG